MQKWTVHIHRECGKKTHNFLACRRIRFYRDSPIADLNMDSSIRHKSVSRDLQVRYHLPRGRDGFQGPMIRDWDLSWSAPSIQPSTSGFSQHAYLYESSWLKDLRVLFLLLSLDLHWQPQNLYVNLVLESECEIQCSLGTIKQVYSAAKWAEFEWYFCVWVCQSVPRFEHSIQVQDA